MLLYLSFTAAPLIYSLYSRLAGVTMYSWYMTVLFFKHYISFMLRSEATSQNNN